MTITLQDYEKLNKRARARIDGEVRSDQRENADEQRELPSGYYRFKVAIAEGLRTLHISHGKPAHGAGNPAGYQEALACRRRVDELEASIERSEHA
jgi:hypothetical protein